jgi:hypothetical protein
VTKLLEDLSTAGENEAQKPVKKVTPPPVAAKGNAKTVKK